MRRCAVATCKLRDSLQILRKSMEVCKVGSVLLGLVGLILGLGTLD